MKIDHSTKTITYEPCELHMVANYIEHVIIPGDRHNWTLKQEIITVKNNEYEHLSIHSGNDNPKSNGR